MLRSPTNSTRWGDKREGMQDSFFGFEISYIFISLC